MQIPTGLVISQCSRRKPRKISRDLFFMPHVLRLPLVPRLLAKLLEAFKAGLLITVEKTVHRTTPGGSTGFIDLCRRTVFQHMLL